MKSAPLHYPDRLEDPSPSRDPSLQPSHDLLHDREPTIFNSRLILFFVATGLFIALLNRQSDLSLLALLVLIVMGGTKAWSALSLARVSSTTQATPGRVFAGETLRLTTTIANRKVLPVWVRLEWSARNLTVAGDGRKQSAQEAGILWHQQACFRQEFTAMRRGVYSAGPTRMQTSDLFGFFRSDKKLPAANTVIVYPKLVNVRKIDVPRCDLFGKPGNRHPIKDPVYITGTRDYQASSPARQIHWKASARHARLQEKVFEPSQQGKVMVVLDVEGFSVNRREREFEHTLQVAASVCLQLEMSGLAIGFATNGTTIGHAFWLTPAGQGPQQVPAVLEALARVQMRPAKSLADTLRQAVLPVRGISCICFASAPSTVLTRMRRACRQKHIPLSIYVHSLDDPSLTGGDDDAAGMLPIQDLLTAGEGHA
jgi:uncharacterized protein (DUF58 family)